VGTRTRRIATAGAAIATLGLAAGGIAFAAGGGGSEDPAGDLAEALNAREGTSLTAEDIRAAMKDVLKERLDEAVAAGRITREEADEILARGARGPGLGPLDGPRVHRHLAPPELLESAAEALGLGESALREELEDGASLAEIAKQRGVATSKVVAAVGEALRESPRGDRLTDAEARRIASRIVNAEPGERGFGHGPPDAGPPIFG
jgi:cytosine/adenosine deaminase-related metal-dependent hydrolase